jgi:hypothetical protein
VAPGTTKSGTDQNRLRRCDGTGEMRCPVRSGTSDPAAPCPQCEGSGVVRCTLCNGSGEEPAEASRPQPSAAAGEDSVVLPRGTARIFEVVNIAWQHHQPSLELLEFPGGKCALRFNAFFNGDPASGPLILDREAIVHLARAAAGTRIQELLKELAGERRADDSGAR